MTWRERRIVSFLSIILLVLFAAVLIVLSLRYRENRPQEETAGDPSLPVSSTQQEELPPFIALAYDNGETNLSFVLDEAGKWSWNDDMSFPLDDTTVQDILHQLLSWAPLETLTDAASLEDAGLDQPEGSLTATTGDNAVTTLLFGNTREDGGRYVRLNGDESTVYVIDSALFTLMEVPIYDMCILPELPPLDENSLYSVAISGATKEDGSVGLSVVLAAQREEEDGPVMGWRCDGANVTSLPMVTALLEDLAAMQFEKCVIYRPSEEALSICGFDNPARLTVGYIAEEGDNAVLILTIGAGDIYRAGEALFV